MHTGHQSATQRVLVLGLATTITIAGTVLAVSNLSTSATIAADPATTEQGTKDPSQIIPQAAQEVLNPEMEEFKEEFPPGFQRPTLQQLIPEATGGTVVSSSGSSLTINSSDNNPVARQLLTQVEDRSAPDANNPGNVTVVTNEGDIAVLMATQWECDWMRHFVNASQKGDTAAVNTAVSQISRFPDLDVIKKYNPSLGEGHRKDVVPPIQAHDLEFAHYWLQTTCSGQ